MYQNKVLLGKRINKPAFGYYFTIGGIVRKNETFKDAQKRIAKNELGIDLITEVNFIGVFEHFYDDSIFEEISTHYINHGYLLELDKELTNIPKEELHLPNDEHSEYCYFSKEELLKNENVHKYVKDYFKNINVGENK